MQEIPDPKNSDAHLFKNPIILFDGVCNFCSSIVEFAIKRDPGGIFKYAPLQSETGRKLLDKFNLPMDDFDTFILIEGEHCFQRSTATLMLFRKLNGLWPILYILIVVPRPIRDFVYNIVAKYRYRLFGRRSDCFIPTPDIRSRFL